MLYRSSLRRSQPGYSAQFITASSDASGSRLKARRLSNARPKAPASRPPSRLCLSSSPLLRMMMASALSGIMFHIGIYTVRAGAFSGFMCWLGFVLTSVAVNNAYAFRRIALTAIDSVHWLGVLVIIGAILGGFGA
ncbi:MAG: DUF1761 domain-containing protein [Sphingobacteriales bacterium]